MTATPGKGAAAIGIGFNGFTSGSGTLTIPAVSITGGTVKANGSIGFGEAIDDSQTLGASGSPIYRITYKLDGSTNADSNPEFYEKSVGVASLADPTGKDDYSFEGWYDNADFNGSPITSIPVGSTGNKTLYAKWTQFRFVINYVLDHGHNASENPSTYETGGGVASLAAPTRTGYDFSGWYDNDSFNGSPITSIPANSAGDKTLYAKWTPHKYTITYEKNGGTMPTLYKGKYTVESSTFSLPTPTRNGYDFYGWYTDADFASAKWTQIKKGTTGDKTFYAKWVVASTPDGTKLKPFKISNEVELRALANKVNGGDKSRGVYYQQTEDITITGGDWTPIGTRDNYFAGNYDGGGYTISGISISSESGYQGLFGSVVGTPSQQSGFIQNIILENSTIKGAAYTGGIVGRMGNGHVLNCHVRSSVSVTGTSDKTGVGGVVGYMYGGTVRNCTNMASVSTGSVVGGIVGYMKNSTGESGMTATATNCFSYGMNPIGKKASGTTATNVERVHKVLNKDGNVTLPEDVPTTDGFLYNGVRYYKGGAVVPFTVNLKEEPGYTLTVSYKPASSAEVIISPDDFGDYYFTVPDENKSFTVKATKTQNMAKLTDDKDLSALTAYAGKTCTVAFSREFTEGKASTVCLPFAYVKKKGDGGFYEFTDITKNDKGEYVATMTDPGVTTLTPNQPYLYMPNATGAVDFGGTYEIPASLTAGSTTSGDWTFRGTYEQLKYGSNLDGHVYGFASRDKEVDGVNVAAGEFVKANDGAGVKPMRCYLTYKNGDEFVAGARAVTRGIEENLPQSITVKFVGANGETTGIATLNTQTGEITTDDAWYTLSGTRLPGKPSQRGIYINKGKAVYIKH